VQSLQPNVISPPRSSSFSTLHSGDRRRGVTSGSPPAHFSPGHQNRTERHFDSSRFSSETHKLNRANRYGGRWFSADTHRDWNRNKVHHWKGHRYRWYDGGWLMIGTGFWPFGYPYYHPYEYSGDIYQPSYVSDYGGGDAVFDVQRALADVGYYYGELDGIFGPLTSRAIADYQTDRGLRVTGRINHALLESLGLV
jgi:hypothetical protein